jgi:outer membrane protein assembly factor BamA
VVALYRGEGFATAAVTARDTVRRGEGRLDVTFSVTEGPRQVLAGVVISGNRGIDTDVIERALRLEQDQPVRPGDWLQARTRVFETGLFRRVDVSPEVLAAGATGDTVPVRMQVAVEEWPALRARYGFQVAEERPEDSVSGRDLRPGLSADITRRTLFGRAVTLGAAAGVQQRERLGRVFLNAPTFAGLPVRSSLIAEAAHRDVAAATLVTSTSSIAWEQRMRVSPRLNLSYVYRFERNHTYDTEPPPGDIPFDILIDVARITGSGAWDTRDDPADTTRGTLLSTSLEFAAERLGSDFAYVRSLSQAYHFRPVKRVVLASAARYGIVEPREGQDLIPSLRFFAGGSRTVRGVDEDSLGETDFFGDPIGGKVLLVLNQEARFPVYRWLRGVGFVDVGNVWAEPPVKLGDMTASAGVGVRLWTPFGILRADFAKTLTSGPEGSGRVTFGIGQAF